MAFRANQQLREDMWDYRYKSSAGESENVLSFSPSAAKDYGTTALNLVHQAAEIFKGMEQQAREIEEQRKMLHSTSARSATLRPSMARPCAKAISQSDAVG